MAQQIPEGIMQKMLTFEKAGTLTPTQIQAVKKARDLGIIPPAETPLGADASAFDLNAQSPFAVIANRAANQPPTTDEGGTELPLGQIGLEMGQSMVGGAIGGSRFGVPGAIGGAAFGAASGNAMSQLLQRAGILPGDAPETSGEAASQIGEAALLGGAGEGAGQGIVRGARGLGILKDSVKPEGRELIDFVGERGVVTPSQATNSRAIDLIQNIAEGAFFGAETIARTKANVKSLVIDGMDNFAQSFVKNTSRAERGEVLQQAVSEGTEAFNVTARTLYAEVDKAVQGVRVNYTGLKRKAAASLRTLEAGLPSGTAKATLNRIMKKGDMASFADAQQLRSDLLNLTRNITDPLPARTEGIVKRLAKEVDNAMVAASEKLPGREIAAGQSLTAKDTWRMANQFWKEGKDTFNSKLVKTIVSKEPDEAVDFLLAQKSELKVKRMRELVEQFDPSTTTPQIGRASSSARTAAGKQAWKNIQGALINKIMDAGTTFKDGVKVLNGNAMLKQINKFMDPNAAGAGTINAFFDPVDARKLQKFARMLAVAEARGATEGGKNYIQFMQVGAGMALLASPFNATAESFRPELAVALFGPAVLAKVLTNPKVAQFLSTGLKVSPRTEQATTFTTKLAALLQEEGIESRVIDNPFPEEDPGSARTPFSGLAEQFQ